MNASPISTARVHAELWAQIKDSDWALVSESGNSSGWAFRLWNFEKHYQHLGDAGGAGVGYGAPAAVGGALANKKHGRLSVNIQGDGDFMYAPGVMWTAAHHKIPLLTVMHNNRGYHQEVMHIQTMANRRERGIFDRVGIGTAITAPNIDYAKLAQSMGLYAEGPITNPNDLAPALKRAIAVVNPALFRRIVTFTRERYPVDRASYHVSAQVERVPDPETIGDGQLPDLLEDFHAREILHVTFGSVLHHPDFREPFFTTLREHEEIYYAMLEKHFGRHFAPFDESARAIGD